MARRKKEESLTEAQIAELKARVLIGEDRKDLSLEFNISEARITQLMAEEPTKIEAQMKELIAHRPEVIETVLDSLVEADVITAKDADTVEQSINTLQQLDAKTQDAALIMVDKLIQVANKIDPQKDEASYIKLSSVVSTLTTLRAGFFKQGTVVNVGNTVNNNTLTLIKGGGKV